MRTNRYQKCKGKKTSQINSFNNNNYSASDVLRRIKEEKDQEDLDEFIRENARKGDLHKLNVRDSNINNLFKIINQSILSLSRIMALIFTIFLVCVSINNYVNHIPIQNELKAAIPISAAFITDIPNNIIKFFKKTPP